MNENLLLKETKFSRLLINYFPLGKFALLVVPKRHVRLITDLERFEIIDLILLYQDAIKKINKNLDIPDLIGWFNQGANVGETIPHFHLHVALFEVDGNLKPVTRIGDKTPVTENLLEIIKSYF
ncbi:MAG: HIT domain-containing protein [Patescibacteria group bacterium]